MSEYFVTFDPDEVLGSPVATAIRSGLEKLAPNNWFQVFPFQIVLRSELSLEALTKKLEIIAGKNRFSIVEASNWEFRDRGRETLMKNQGF
jgi:hypothetical protein